MSPNRRNVIVGFVVLLALGILAWMSLQFANQGFAVLFDKGTPASLYVPRADGVSEGSAVFYLGVNVGQVRAVELNSKGGGVIIHLVVNQGNQVPTNVEGSIKSGGLLGSTANIGLEPVGEPSSELLHPNQELRIAPNGGGNSLIPAQFTGILDDVQKRELVKHLDETIVSLRDQAIKFGKVMDSTNELLGDKKMREDLKVALANLRSTSEKADKVGTELQTFTTNLNGTTKGLNDRIEQAGKTLEKFDQIAAKIDKGDGTLGLLTNDPRLYESLTDTSKELKLMVSDLKRLVEQWEQEGVSLKLK